MMTMRNLVLFTLCLGVVNIVCSGLARPREQFDSRESAERTIRIVDSAGQPVPNASPNPNGQTIDVDVGPGGDLMFAPNNVTIAVGDTVRWTWMSSLHSVSSGQSCNIDDQFCSPSDMDCDVGILSNLGQVYTHTFSQAGTYEYGCALHCSAGMTGVVNVVMPFVNVTGVLRNGTGFIINGLTTPNATVTIKSTDDLTMGFANPAQATADSDGVFQFTDTNTTGATKRFYLASYP